MTEQINQRESVPNTGGGEGLAARTAEAAKTAFFTASAIAGDAANKSKRAASDATATVAEQLKQALDHQVGNGAEMMGHIACSVRRAAEDLDHDVPQLAGFVRTFADRVDGYADDLNGKSVDQIVRAASDFTRRQPVLVAGLAALAGFFTLRALKSTSSVSSPSIQPVLERQRDRGDQAGEFHGA